MGSDAPSNANTSGLAPTDALRLVLDLARKGANTPGCNNWRAASMCRQIVEVLDKSAPASPLPGGGCLGAEHLSAAITRLTQLAAGDEIEAAYADFTFPGHTFRADIRALLSALPAAPTGDAP